MANTCKDTKDRRWEERLSGAALTCISCREDQNPWKGGDPAQVSGCPSRRKPLCGSPGKGRGVEKAGAIAVQAHSRKYLYPFVIMENGRQKPLIYSGCPAKSDLGDRRWDSTCTRAPSPAITPAIGRRSWRPGPKPTASTSSARRPRTRRSSPRRRCRRSSVHGATRCFRR